MVGLSVFLVTVSSVPLVLAFSVAFRSSDAVAFLSPVLGGGSWLNDAGNGLGEPLNVVISGLSTPEILSSDDAFINYARAIGFSTECFGVHLGDPQAANLGDGHGPVNQTVELRQDFGDADVGTCLESLIGGNHFRHDSVYHQNGPTADSGALFLAVSQEEDVSQGHTISPDGYNTGRDNLAAAASGVTSFNGVTYNTVVEKLPDVMPAGTNGVNHDIAIDGTVVLLTVNIQ